MSSATAMSDALSTQNLELAPLRSLDDFVLGSARFQLPNLKDLEKWGNRVVKNLLYYQTNYFLLFLGVYGSILILNPAKIIFGLIVQTMIIAVLVQFFLKKSTSKFKFLANLSVTQRTPQQKWYFLAGVLLCGYLLLHWLNAILLTSFAFLLPISFTQRTPQQKWYFLAGVLLCGYLLLHWLNAILLTSFAFLLPISLTFIHASLRLRNMKNKVVNTMESLNPSTPMGVFLDVFNITMDN